MQIPRDREELYLEALAIAGHGSDEQVREWRSGLSAEERVTLDALTDDLKNWFVQFRALLGGMAGAAVTLAPARQG